MSLFRIPYQALWHYLLLLVDHFDSHLCGKVAVLQCRNLRTLEQRRVDAKVIMMFKIIHGLVAIPVPPYFKQPMRSTRHSHPLALRQIHTTANYYKFAFFPSTVVYWNQLPAQIVLLPTLDQFSVASSHPINQHKLFLSCF